MRSGFRKIVLAAVLTAAPALASRVSGAGVTLQLAGTLSGLIPDAGPDFTAPETLGGWLYTGAHLSFGLPALTPAPLPDRRDDSLLRLADWSYTIGSVTTPAQSNPEIDSEPVPSAPLFTPERESWGIAALAIAVLLWRNLATRGEAGKRYELVEMRGSESAFRAAGARKG